MPLVRRVPKRGFNNRFAQLVETVNVSDLEQGFESGDEVTLETLRAKALAKARCDVLKVLGDGELTKRLIVHAHRFSGSAKDKIERVGGEAMVVPGKAPVQRRKKISSESAQ